MKLRKQVDRKPVITTYLAEKATADTVPESDYIHF
jgi:hypothetical protein